MWIVKPVLAAALVLALVGCAGGDDDDQAAADWCERSEYAFRAVDNGYAPPISLDAADLWIEAAPDEIQASTEAAARFLRELRSTPFPQHYTDARAEMEAYAKDHCQPGVGDGVGND